MPSATAFAEASDSHVDLLFRLAFGGIRFVMGAADERLDADPSLGGDVRFDIPLGEYFSLGPVVSVYTVRPENSGTNRQPVVDIDPFVKIRKLAGSRERVELYGLFQGGFTMAFLRESYRGSQGDRFGAGWNVGVAPGVRVLMGRRFGIIAELGWMRTQWKTESYKLIFNQGVLRAGLSF